MPPRRTVLSSLVGGIIGVSGCVSPNGVPGYIFSKSIEGRERNESFEHVLGVGLTGPNREIESGVSDRWEGYVDDPKAPTISGSFHEKLHREYHEVRYMARFCSEQLHGDSYGCIRDFVDREDFNRAQVDDRVRATYLDERDRIEIHSVIGTRTDSE